MSDIAHSYFAFTKAGWLQCKFCKAEEETRGVKEPQKGVLKGKTNLDNKRKHLLRCPFDHNNKIPRVGIAKKLKKRGEKGLHLSVEEQQVISDLLNPKQSDGSKGRHLSQASIRDLPDALKRDKPDKINEKLAEMILSLGLPFSLVDKREFREFIALLSPSYEQNMCHRKQLVETYVQRVAAKFDDKVLEHLQGRMVSLDLDGFEQTNHKQVKQISITDEEGHAFSYGFDSGIFEDAEAYRDVFKKTITELRAKSIQVRSIGSDNASVMMKARKLVKEDFPEISTIACSFHSVDLLGNLPTLEGLQAKPLKDANTLLNLFRKRSLNKHLVVIREEHNKKADSDYIQTLKRPGETRKLSKFFMLQSIKDNVGLIRSLVMEPLFIQAVEKANVRELYDEVVKIIQNRDARWNEIENVTTIYGILHQTQRQLESNTCDLSRMYSLLTLLVDQLKSCSSISAELGENISAEAKEKLARYIGCETIICAALDPRRHSHRTRESGKWHLDLKQMPVMVSKLYSDDDGEGSKFLDVLTACFHHFLDQQKFCRDKKGKLLREWDSLMYHDIPDQEVLGYNYDYSPLEFWKYFLKPQTHLQTLAEEVAIPLLSLKASSAVVERCNSANKFVQSVTRNRLSASTCNSCLKVYVNNRALRKIREGVKPENKPLPSIIDLADTDSEVDTYDDFDLTKPAQALELDIEDALQNEFFDNFGADDFPELEDEQY